MRFEDQDRIFCLIIVVASYVFMFLVLYNYFRKKKYCHKYILWINESSTAKDGIIVKCKKKCDVKIKHKKVKMKKDIIKIKSGDKVYTIKYDNSKEMWILNPDRECKEIVLSTETILDDTTCFKIEKRMILGWYFWAPVAISAIVSTFLDYLFYLVATARTFF